jgi:hypothetical protein
VVTLEILQPGHERMLDDIASVGWRLDRQVRHPRVRTTDVTPKWDGSHEVVKTVTQQATFYFVREVDPNSAWRPTPAAPTWPAGWYQTEHGQHVRTSNRGLH